MAAFRVLQFCKYCNFVCMAILRVWQGEFMAGGSSLELQVFWKLFVNNSIYGELLVDNFMIVW